MQGFIKRCALLVAAGLCAGSLQAAEKVIFDTDFNVLNDDGQAFIMLAQLHARERQPGWHVRLARAQRRRRVETHP